jgi:OmpA family
VSEIFIPELIEETSVGIFARHPQRFELPVLVAPTTADRADATNRVRQSLVTVACANLKDFAFAFDSSVLAPASADGFTSLSKLLTLYPGFPISLFGHADPVGDPKYNKFLSERRARSVFGLLLRRTEVWEHLFSDQDGATGDIWGARAIQTMIGALGFPPGEDGKFDQATHQAFTDCLISLGGAVPGRQAQNTTATRKVLFAAYMDFLTPIDPRDATRKWRLDPADFLDGAKTSLGAPGDLQGCSEFNPQLIFARDERVDFEQRKKAGEEDRNAANEPNRRIVIYVFDKGTTKPANWPCPAAKAGIKGCKDRFWSDGDKRISVEFVAHRRRFGKEVPESLRTLDPADDVKVARFGRAESTFGCRFYHGFALHSPCERDLKMWVLRAWSGGPTAPIGGARYAAFVGSDPDSPVVRGVTTANGTLGLPVFDTTVAMTLRIDVGPVAPAALPLPETLVVDNPRVLDPPDPSGPPGEDPEPANAPKGGTVDPAAWPGEEQFLELVLDAGQLARVGKVPSSPADEPPSDSPFDADVIPPVTDAENHQGTAQRLRNLAFGDATLLTDPAAFKEGVRRFQLTFRARDKADGDPDDDTMDRLVARYGELIKTESAPT